MIWLNATVSEILAFETVLFCAITQLTILELIFNDSSFFSFDVIDSVRWRLKLGNVGGWLMVVYIKTKTVQCF